MSRSLISSLPHLAYHLQNGFALVLAVIDMPAERIGAEEERLAKLTELAVTVIDPATHDSMLRLARSGLIASPMETMEVIYPRPGDSEAEDNQAGLLRARALADRATHKLKAAQLLAGGGFAEEARAPTADAIRLAAGTLAVLACQAEPEDVEEAAGFLLRQEPGGEADGIALDAVRVLSGDAEEQDPVGIAAAFLDHVSKQVSDTTSGTVPRGS